MIVRNNVVIADSGKYLKYGPELALEFTLGKKFVCKNGKTVLVEISLRDITEVYSIRVQDKDYYISATNYNEAVSELIRQKYSLDLELALYANTYIKDNSSEMEEYLNWRKVCKEAAKAIFNE